MYKRQAQYIKNAATQSARAVKAVDARTRFALTGTPVENRLGELWSIFDYLMPGFLFGVQHFRKEYELPVTRDQDEEALSRLRRITGPFIPVSYTHLGFGTMNGKDGKPFKTREGGVMRLERLIADINEAVYQRIVESEKRSMTEEEARAAAPIIGLAALKYGDLSNHCLLYTSRCV